MQKNGEKEREEKNVNLMKKEKSLKKVGIKLGTQLLTECLCAWV